jgi:hypothetical protein
LSSQRDPCGPAVELLALRSPVRLNRASFVISKSITFTDTALVRFTLYFSTHAVGCVARLRNAPHHLNDVE